MIRHIVFHADVDGVFSAALFLHHSLGEGYSDYVLYPVTSTQRGERFLQRVEAMGIEKDDELIILDYENHADSTMWIDHHYNSGLRQNRFETSNVLYDVNVDSASQLVAEKLYNYPHCNDHVMNIVQYANMVDSAKYPSIDAIFNDYSPESILRTKIENSFPHDMMLCRVVEALADLDFDIDSVNTRLNLKDDEIESVLASARMCKRAAVIFGNISLIHQIKPGQFPRYAEYLEFPDIDYAIRTSPVRGNKYRVQIGFNNWGKNKKSINIGMFLGKCDIIKGGGHRNVGGGLVDIDKFEEFIELFSNAVSPKEKCPMEEEMEKLGVDHENDPIEKKADELVKTGSAKSVDEGREKVVEETNGTAQ